MRTTFPGIATGGEDELDVEMREKRPHQTKERDASGAGHGGGLIGGFYGCRVAYAMHAQHGHCSSRSGNLLGGLRNPRVGGRHLAGALRQHSYSDVWRAAEPRCRSFHDDGRVSLFSRAARHASQQSADLLNLRLECCFFPVLVRYIFWAFWQRRSQTGAFLLERLWEFTPSFCYCKVWAAR